MGVSENKSEITLTIPADEAERLLGLDAKAFGGPHGIPQTKAMVKEALAARKTELEKWREQIQAYTAVGRGLRVPHLHYQKGLEICVLENSRTARLMAAAPQMLDALISMRTILDMYLDAKGRPYPHPSVYEDAIKAALPEAVSKEVLGE